MRFGGNNVVQGPKAVVAILQLWNLAAAGLWYAFLSRRVRHVVDKQDPGVLFLAFAAGLLSVFLTILLHYLYPLSWIAEAGYGYKFPYHILVTGPVEETAKFLCFLVLVSTMPVVKEPQDGVLIGAAVGMGFGTLENILYIFKHPQWWIALRPILTTGGHMIYGAIWAGMFSSAMYSNIHSRDPQAYRLALGALLLAALIHGAYNSVPWVGLMVLVNLAALYLAVRVFLLLVERSPYRDYPLEQAEAAAAALRRGLFFNPNSAILNRRLGLCLMYLGRYRDAAAHLKRSLPRSTFREMPWLYCAVCEYAFVPIDHARAGLRKRWGRLRDAQRGQALAHLRRLLANDEPLRAEVLAYLGSALKPRQRLDGEALAMELRRRKAQRKLKRTSPRMEERIAELSEEERDRLARRLRGARMPRSGRS
jgi:RsiW-degrading membrane proteinase PrsW (M82 family)